MERPCYDCENQKEKKIVTCLNCLESDMLTIIPTSCKICCAPFLRDSDICQNCEDNGNGYIDDIIPITYGIKERDFSEMVYKYKKGYANQYLLPLSYSLYGFLIYNYNKIKEKFGQIDYFTYIPSFNNKRAHIEKIINNVHTSIFEFTNLLKQQCESKEMKDKNQDERTLEKDKYALLNNIDVSNKNIILFDDVCTTVSTIGSAGYVLKENGAKTVIGVVLFRQVYDYFRQQVKNFTVEHPFSFKEWKYDIK
jgi:competence protein ComFC